MKKDSIAYVVLFTFVACAAFIAPLALANEFTKPRVEANRLFATHSAVLRAFGIAYADPADAEAKYASLVRPEGSGTDAPPYRATIEGIPCVAVRRTGSGLWGSITMIVAADERGERLRGVEILDQVETPGLGGRIDEPWFKEQFRGELLGPDGLGLDQSGGSGKGDPDKENARVDGVTGASRTSDFVRIIVNGAIAEIKAAGGAK
ncbi:MAG: FMN-binding protein [Spirochaetaceae bacterium]|nr:FMN-binding protein [Spirochaetaceae bacterium]